MADPASIIGTAVGVTSLGIQACQILSQYYSQFRDFSHDIDAVVNRAEGLSQSLEVLESLRPRVEICDSSVAKQLQFAIEKCTIGLRDLQAMATKCGENTAPVTLKDRARLLKKRMLWPLRQETLVSLRGTLDGLQANVQIAVQLLDIDAGDRVFRSLQITTTTVSTHSATVERLLNKQCAALGTIQQGMNDLSQGRFSTDEAARLLRESQQISSQLEDVEQKLAMLLSASQSQQLQFDSSPQRPHCSSRQALGKTASAGCTCRSSTTSLWWTGLGGLFDVDVFRESKHRADCWFYRGESVLTCRARYRQLRRLLNMDIEASISYMRTSGQYSIQPMISVTSFVSESSPAFASILKLGDRVMRSSMRGWSVNRGNDAFLITKEGAPALMESAFDEIIQAYYTGLGSPHDILSDGRTVLDCAYILAFYLLGFRCVDAQIICELLGKLIHRGGLRFNEQPFTKLTERILFYYEIYYHPDLEQGAHQLWSQMISKMDEWSYPRLIDSWAVASPIFASLLRSEEHLSKFHCACPLELAVLRNSKQDLIQQLHSHDPTGCHKDSPCQNDLRMVSLAIFWQEGLHILLSGLVPSKLEPRSKCYADTDERYFSRSIAYAIDLGNLESLVILSDAGYPVFPEAWKKISSVLSLEPRYRRNHGVGVQELRRVVKSMYKATTHRMTRLVHGRWEPFEVVDCADVFHADGLTRELCQYLLDAGFEYSDEAVWTENHYGTKQFRTTLWSSSVGICFHYPEWDLLDWMSNHGANLHWRHPQSLTTPAHIIGLPCASGVQHEESTTKKAARRSLMKQILVSEHTDQCLCHCSVSGCLPITCTASVLSYSEDISQFRLKGCVSLFRTITNVVDFKRSKSTNFALAVIRLLTFDRLGLTHTCCKRIKNEWSPDFDECQPEEQIVEDIRYHEGKDIEILETLIQMFECAWTDFPGNFLSFFRTIWIPRMRLHDEKLAAEPESDVVKRLEGIGVVLWAPFGPRTEPESTHGSNHALKRESEDEPLDQKERHWRDVERLLSLETEDRLGYDSDDSSGWPFANPQEDSERISTISDDKSEAEIEAIDTQNSTERRQEHAWLHPTRAQRKSTRSMSI